jgi:hypothetical protein
MAVNVCQWVTSDELPCDGNAGHRSALCASRLRTPQLQELPAHRRRPNTQPLTNPGQRPARRAKPSRFGDLLRRKTTLSHRHAVALQDDTHSSPVDSEPITQLGESGSFFVALDELPHLLLIELPRSPRLPLDHRPR